MAEYQDVERNREITRILQLTPREAAELIGALSLQLAKVGHNSFSTFLNPIDPTSPQATRMLLSVCIDHSK